MKYITIFVFVLLFLSSCGINESPTNATKPQTVTTTQQNSDDSSLQKVSASYSITFACKDQKNKYISDLYVYVDDSRSCLFGVTKNGKTTIKVQSKKFNVVVYDKKKRKKYGIVAMKYTYSSSSITIKIPDFPTSKAIAGKLMDSFVKGLNYANTSFELYDLWNLIKGIKGYSFGGVPGVFSMNPIPTPDANGKLGFGVSGIVVDEMFKYFPLVNGKYNYYKKEYK